MTWRDNPEIMAARDFAKRFGYRRVVIFCEGRDARVGYVSYGADRELCAKAAQAADQAFDAVAEAFEQTAWGFDEWPRAARPTQQPTLLEV